MRNRIIGAIGVLWGGSVLIYHFMKNGMQINGGPGQLFGLVFAALLLLVGLYYLLKR